MQNHVFVENCWLLIQANNWEKFVMVCGWGNGLVSLSAVGMVYVRLLWCFFCNYTQIVAVVQKKEIWKSCKGVADHVFTLLASAGL